MKSPTSVVCSDNHGGGIRMSIFLPLYVTAGATSLIFPARACCQKPLAVLQTRWSSGKTYIDFHGHIPGNRLHQVASVRTSRNGREKSRPTWGCLKVCSILLIGPKGTLRRVITCKSRCGERHIPDTSKALKPKVPIFHHQSIRDHVY